MTATEICNRALAALGHDRTITDLETDPSAEAERCRQFYSSALEDVLSAHDWDWAAIEAEVILSARDANGRARVSVPPDCVRLIQVFDGRGNGLAVRRVGDTLIVSPGADNMARLRYITRDIDTAFLPHGIREAIIYQLAAVLAGPMFGNDSKTEGFMNLAKLKLSEAITIESDETANPGEWENPLIAARR